MNIPSALNMPPWCLLGASEESRSCRYGADAAMYGLALRHGAGVSCEDAAVKELVDLLKLVRASAGNDKRLDLPRKPECSTALVG